VDFIGTPGADNVAAGRVTGAALGAVDLVGAADAVPGRVSGAALVVADLVAAVVEVPMGQGRAVLFGMRPQYRGQSYQAFKLFFNALLLSSVAR